MLADGLRQLCALGTTTGKAGITKNARSITNADPSTLGIVFMAFLCAILPMDISQLSFAIIGAVLYALLQKSDQLKPKKQRISVVVEAAPQNPSGRTLKQQKPTAPRADSAAAPVKEPSTPTVSQEIRAPSVRPIVAPTFQSDGWEGEVRELLLQITPNEESEQAVEGLTQIVRRTLQSFIPEVEIHGFAHGNLTFGKAFGVAVPEVDIVAKVSPQILYARLHGSEPRGSSCAIDVKKLQKSAIRACTDKLVAAGGFKFRRSAFRGQEPKVTLLAPASLGLFSDSIPIDFSVNAVTPLYNTALLTECGNIDIRAKELVLLVKRWAKDRGICHAAKGHLSPYVWSIVTMYFLQVGSSKEDQLLPPLDQFEVSNALLKGKKNSVTQKWTPSQTTKSVATLFKEFVHFFDTEFDWCNEAVSISAAKRGPPGLDIPLHIIVSEDGAGTSQVGPTIEDPFHTAQNLGDGMNIVSLARLKEELSRAEQLCLRGASLSELLEPWAPAESFEANGNEDHGELRMEPSPQSAPKQIKQAPVKGEDWRRDAMEAQAAKPASPPWRRPAKAAP